MEEKLYSMNELAEFTGLTTRTLRNYLKLGLLNGEKKDGIWKFSQKDIQAFFDDKNVSPSIKAKQNAVVFDFLLDDKKTQNEICMILDLNIPGESTAYNKVSNFFCEQIKTEQELANFRFSLLVKEGHLRIILKGNEEQIFDIMKKYREWYTQYFPTQIFI